MCKGVAGLGGKGEGSLVRESWLVAYSNVDPVGFGRGWAMRCEVEDSRRRGEDSLRKKIGHTRRAFFVRRVRWVGRRGCVKKVGSRERTVTGC